MTDPVLDSMNDLVARDHAPAGPPDVAGLVSGGRRRVLRRRLAVGGVAAAVALAVVVPLAVVGGDDPRAVEPPPATSTTTPAPTPTPTPSQPSTTPAEPPRAQEVRVPLPGGRYFTGILETRTIRGATIPMAPYEGYDLFAYAASRGDSTCLSVGLRLDGRIVQLICALSVPIENRWVMWNGYRDDNGEGDGYELLGVFEGDTTVSIGPSGGPTRAVTTRRTDVLPGYTVIYDKALWDESWDPLQAAPLTVTTGSGETYTLRRNSYVS